MSKKNRKIRECFYCERLTRNKHTIELVDKDTKQTVTACDKCSEVRR